MFKAQDMNMTNGDYAFFTITGIPDFVTEQLWLAINWTGQDKNYRIKGLYSLKQVRKDNTQFTIIYHVLRIVIRLLCPM
jgi:hypothetical protein